MPEYDKGLSGAYDRVQEQYKRGQHSNMPIATPEEALEQLTLSRREVELAIRRMTVGTNFMLREALARTAATCIRAIVDLDL